MDLSQTLEFLGQTFAIFLDCFLSVSRAINDHSATITIALSVLGAIFVWLLYRHRTKRRLKVEVSLSLGALDSLKEMREIHESGKNPFRDFKIWDVFLINPGYHPVHVEKVILLYQNWFLGKKEEMSILHEYPMGITIKPGGKQIVFAKYRAGDIESCIREISGAYAVDKTGKTWRARKKLKIEE